ncbi:O-methyltransferase [Paenibacillus hodogayensis]|uniref:O-methyltransferase n=1 Tax=Paenibacillus hodogayensis TaxID=279208 RepID=A0ABV5VWQ7_9BACL
MEDRYFQTADRYVESLYEADADLERVNEAIKRHGMPDISVAPGYGRLLTMLVRLSGAKRLLEIGALGGYSGICLARGLDGAGKLLSLELKEEFAAVAKANVTAAGFGGVVDYRIGEALTSLEQLGEEGTAFDFFFIDADKGNYVNYLDWAIRLAAPGALIVGDNALLHGKTMDPEAKGSSVAVVREFNRRFAADPRLESTILPAYDGLCIARVKR